MGKNNGMNVRKYFFFKEKRERYGDRRDGWGAVWETGMKRKVSNTKKRNDDNCCKWRGKGRKCALLMKR